MFSTNLYLADGFTIQDNEKKLIFTVSTHCIQGSILKMLSVLLWSARLHFNENMWHLSKWCSVPTSLRCDVKPRGWVQTHMPCPDTWQELQIYFIKHLLKACLNHISSLVKILPSYWLEFLQVLPMAEGAHGAKQVAWHLILPLTQVSYRIYPWNKNFKVSQGELSPKCVKCNHFLKLC